MSTLPALDPPVPIKDVTGVYLLEGRRYVRRVGSDAALTALRNALDVSRDHAVATLWQFGQRSTFGGRSDRFGCGVRVEWSIPEHAEYLKSIAGEVHEKGTGPCRTLGEGRYKGSSDREFVARSGLFLDCDGCGPVEPLMTMLDSVGLAYIIQTRPGTDRWHAELFYGTPLQLGNMDASEDELRSWKNLSYRPMTGWLMGIFSELGELDCRFEMHNNAVSISKLGADAAVGNRLLGLGNPYTRRSHGEPTPETVFREGSFINVQSLLISTDFSPPVKADVRSARKGTALKSAAARTTEACDEIPLFATEEEPEGANACGNAITGAFTAAQFVHRTINGLAIIRCPFGDGHTTGTDGDTSTAILPNGFVKCFHGSCASRSQADFFHALPREAQEVVLDALPEMAGETEDALFGPHILKLAARVSVEQPFRFARVRAELLKSGAPVDRWMSTVRKERRA
jgi:hypothetical protein